MMVKEEKKTAPTSRRCFSKQVDGADSRPAELEQEAEASGGETQLTAEQQRTINQSLAVEP